MFCYNVHYGPRPYKNRATPGSRAKTANDPARLVESGQLHKIQRGLYSANVVALSEHMSLLEVSHRVPRAVICLLSALRFHEIGTQMPSEVWIALDGKAWAPKISHPPVRIVRFSGEALRHGVQERRVEGGTLRVYSP